MTDGAVIRPATAGDLAAIRRILAAHDNDSPVPAGGTDVVGPYLRHMISVHRALVSEQAGEVVAFGAVVDTGRAAMLADLFVLPDRLGRGIGRPLLDALFDGAPTRATFASADPRALPLYVRAGMTPLWVSLYVEGTASALPEADASLSVRAATPHELAGLEEAWTGAARPRDHEFWASQAEADAFLVEGADGAVAIGYGRAKQASPSRTLERLLVRPDADPVAPALAGLARAGRGGPVIACVAGPSPLLPVLLARGFRIVDRDQYLASSPTLVDPARLLPNPGML